MTVSSGNPTHRRAIASQSTCLARTDKAECLREAHELIAFERALM